MEVILECKNFTSNVKNLRFFLFRKFFIIKHVNSRAGNALKRRTFYEKEVIICSTWR